MNKNKKHVLIDHGSGSDLSGRFINDIFVKTFSNSILDRLEDASPFAGMKNMAITTDSYTVDPLFFSGGDIGKLSVCGTCNDLAVMGARPMYLSCGFIIEEGFSIDDLEVIVKSMKSELDKNGAGIICGDTKVVPRGAADGIFINTTGIGEIVYKGISSSNLSDGDTILLSNSVGEHGAHIFVSREGIDIKSSLESDCCSLWPLVKLLIESGIKIKAMRDATRGGLSAVLNEWAGKSGTGIQIIEDNIPVLNEVKGICELLGFEPYHLACEGTFVIAVDNESADDALQLMKGHELGKSASIIGHVDMEHTGKVVMNTGIGTKRILISPAGPLLPRIC